MLVASLSHLLKSGIPASSSALLQLSRHFPPAPQDSLLPASLFIPLGTSLLAPQIRHLLTLCASINFIYLLITSNFYLQWWWFIMIMMMMMMIGGWYWWWEQTLWSNNNDIHRKAKCKMTMMATCAGSTLLTLSLYTALCGLWAATWWLRDQSPAWWPPCRPVLWFDTVSVGIVTELHWPHLDEVASHIRHSESLWLLPCLHREVGQLTNCLSWPFLRIA